MFLNSTKCFSPNVYPNAVTFRHLKSGLMLQLGGFWVFLGLLSEKASLRAQEEHPLPPRCPLLRFLRCHPSIPIITIATSQHSLVPDCRHSKNTVPHSDIQSRYDVIAASDQSAYCIRGHTGYNVTSPVYH